ncbi:tRNA pseudouridine synthase A [Rhodomicrobium vannielii ATCC 17100]|uniref:tRNA pseudouridine synthase A n=1 Tax=Rhodomicrobium vannielii (strain ATCC 17100 / DSM 162 / LMG 4299 / NCIMB 10020 / ATH 3.1.1) TaxID=648757 RepID=E3HZZ0_RHOVT|nr:tRNA pseudouridine(38-40) synthase TruA [Rhodomicrobium vannielii]ADP69941.1 tRNA pseudouridine synthase A [Rhodomicrobium vannielii ATCC 17100]
MPRYKITIEYDGTPFSGWQMQANGRSVQDHLARAIERFTGVRAIPRGAGRTDAGVHARGQVAHVDLERRWPPETVRNALNFHLRPAPMVILACEEVDETFDARFSAKARHYLYRIVTRRSPLALDRDRAWHIGVPLDAEAMQEGARHLLGHHDFTTFRASQCQAKSPLRTLDTLTVRSEGESVFIATSARSFLHNQVRSMAGSLKLVGEGKWQPERMREALEARDRRACGSVAPACGLYFMTVDY